MIKNGGRGNLVYVKGEHGEFSGEKVSYMEIIIFLFTCCFLYDNGIFNSKLVITEKDVILSLNSKKE